MVWIYLQESEESHSPSKNGLNQSHTVKSNPIAKVSSCKECKKKTCPKHQFGMTYEHYPLKNCQESTSSMEVAPAKISLLQDMQLVWKESEADLFLKYFGYSTKQKLPSYSLKMSQTLGPKEQNEFAKNFPKEGMIVDGVCYPLVMWERDIKGKDVSYWATPNTMDWLPLRSKEALDRQFATTRKGRTKPANLREQIHPHCWPTPRSTDATGGAVIGETFKRRYKVGKAQLRDVAKNLPTPAARDWKDNASPSEYNRNTPTLATRAGGQLNPQFVEWLMGYHIEWTGLKPLETQ